MENSSVDYSGESEPFTFPQVKPLYARLLNEAGRSTRKPLKPFIYLQEPIRNVPVDNECQENIQDVEDDSLSVNSLSGDLKPLQKPESHLNSERNYRVINERCNFDQITPLPTKLRAQISVQRTNLVKRVPKTCFKTNENLYAKDSKLSQHPLDFEKLPKTNGGQDKLGTEGRSVNDGRVLKNILNYDLNTEKPVDDVKTHPKCINSDKKDLFIMPSISYRKETGVPDIFRKSPKAANRMTPAIETNKNTRSCATRNVSRELTEKPKVQQVLFKETDDEKPEMINYNPSVFKRTENSVLSVNNVQYSILSKLGQGGSSQVYQVLDTRTSALLAVKCVNLSEADEVTAMGYLKEIEMLSKLQSSNRVIKLFGHEYLKQQQMLYVVMEKGDTDLSTLLKQMTKSGDVSLPMIIYYWTEMLHAVKQIHSHGIVHADLKPANFLLVCGRLKLIDFGIASAIQTDATSVYKSFMHGTCNYMSPEAIQDPSDSSRTKVGYKSDVWSLGCILYNLLYQKTPFQHITNNIKKLQIIANSDHRIEFPPIEKCPPPLMDALKHCLTHDAKKRPTVDQLLARDYIWPTG